jgi:hypothetical protein
MCIGFGAEFEELNSGGEFAVILSNKRILIFHL